MRLIDIDAALVERKIVEHFAPDARGRVRSALATVDVSPTGHGGASVERIQLAAIKLARGDPELLERYVLLAGIDWRDVLAPAESPRYDWSASPEEKERLVALDREDYEAWITQPGPHAGRGVP